MSDEEPPAVVIVGGGPAGLAAARSFRETGGAGPVLLVTADDYAPYNRPPLTKDYLRGETAAEDLPLVDPDWYAEHGVELRLGTPAVSVDPRTRRLRLSDGSTVEYGHLVLATGSSPRSLPVPGGDLPGVIYVRDRHSAEALVGIAERGRRAIVIGSGFIGCEAAASLARRGVRVVLVSDESVPHAARLGEDAGRRIREWLRAEGVELRLGDGVAGIRQEDGTWRIRLASGAELETDAVVSGSGAAPNLALAESAGLTIENGGVVTDAGMRSSDPRIWAVGDIAYAYNEAAGRRLRVEHWGEAEAMGEIAGANIAGADRHWAQAPGFWSTIGDRDLKYSAWGDGYDEAVFEEVDGGWAVWYVSAGRLVGVLASERDEAYERGQELIERHAPVAEAVRSTAGDG